MFATPQDLATDVNVALENEAQVQQAIDFAEAAVLSVLGSAAVPADPSPQFTLLKAVVVDVAKRRVLNPEGFTSETVGDYTYRRDTAAGFLTPAERSTIRFCGGRGNGVYSVPLTTPAESSWPYVAP